MRRQRRTKEQWDSIFASQLASWLTASEYCPKHGIHHNTFFVRKSDFNKRTSQSTSNKLVKVITSECLCRDIYDSLPQRIDLIT